MQLALARASLLTRPRGLPPVERALGSPHVGVKNTGTVSTRESLSAPR